MLGHLYIHLHTTCDMQIRGDSMEISMAFHQETKKTVTYDSVILLLYTHPKESMPVHTHVHCGVSHNIRLMELA